MSVGCTSQSWSQIKLVLASMVNQHFSMVVSAASTEFQLLLKRKGKKQSSCLGRRSKLRDCGPVENCFGDTVEKEKQWENVLEPQRGPVAVPNGSIPVGAVGVSLSPPAHTRGDMTCTNLQMRQE